MFYKHPTKLRGIGKLQYPSRIIGIYFGAIVFMVNQYEAGLIDHPINYVMLAIAITYPHIALFIYWKSNSNRKVESRMLLADTFFSGLILPWMGFNLLPCLVMGAFTAAGTMVSKGFFHFLKGILFIGIGSLVGTAALGFNLDIQFHNGFTIVLTVGIFVATYATLFSFSANRFVVQIIKIKRQVAKQQLLIQEQHQDILDSINYAKRIQTAILPSSEKWNSHLNNSFVLYIPKDVVAGDFYWMKEEEGELLFAAADCTGHGVPGAMVSVVCNNSLNRAVKEYGLTEPGPILDKTKELVVEEFTAADEYVKDGMDIALCSLKGNTLKYAGAHNPLWIIRKGATEIEEYKATKQPVGKFEKGTQFKTHTVQLNEGDRFYLFSDGFSDQFGGENGKKFKSKRMKSLLLELQSKSMSEQNIALAETFQNWKGDLEQLDDICVIGVQFN